ncbi:MAG: pyrroline-5-carboxylate reductase [Bacillota bacterium]
MTYEFGIIGAGNMAEAITRGILSAKLFTPRQILAADLSPQRRELFSKQLGIQTTEDNAQVARNSKIILLSVKPQHMQAALATLAPVLSDQTLIISIAAGVSTAAIEKHLAPGKSWRIIRVMPNTPMLVGAGMVALAPGRHAQPADLATAQRIFEAGATVLQLPEDKIDAVTAISGSGPAYFFFLVEYMVQAGVELGLTPEQAHILATRTAAGAAKMLLTSPDSPKELRRKVTSPGGTTQAAIETMEAQNMPQTIVTALHRAAQRSKELGSK